VVIAFEQIFAVVLLPSEKNASRQCNLQQN